MTCSSDTSWKELYIAALFENDKSKAAQKIVGAQMAIIARRQESFAAGMDTKERHVLDAALLCLQALANCVAIKPGLVPAIRAASIQATDVHASWRQSA